MKERYLEELKEKLNQYNISEEELNDILSDYEEMIDDAMDKGLSEDKIIELIGTPKKVVKNLADTLSHRDDEFGEVHHVHLHKRRKDNRIVALMPFISLIVFMILGLGYNLWHPGWMVFLSIPIVAIIVNAFEKRGNGFVALSPFIAVVGYMILGFVFELWHPGWLIFLIIPVFGILNGSKGTKFITLMVSLSPFIAVTLFFIWLEYLPSAEFAWLSFLLIPFFGGLHYEKPWKVLLFQIALLGAVGVFLYFQIATEVGLIAALVFLVPIGVSILLSENNVFSFEVGRKDLPMFMLSVLCILIYVVLGIVFPETWAYMWMIFLLIPMYAIIKHAGRKNKLVALMPFIATIIFFSLGFFLQLWAFSWIAFLLIPITAIIKNA